jgi:integrase
MAVLAAGFGERRLPDITPRLIEGWMTARLAAGVSHATLNRNRAGLSVLFEWCIAEGYFPGPNPTKRIRRFREGPGRDRYLTAEESDRLIMASAPHLRTVLYVLLYTGARLSEALKLTWADCDFSAGLIIFRRNTTKGQRVTRAVPIAPRLLTHLRSLRRGREDQTVCSWGDAPLKSVKTAFATAKRKAGLGEDVVLHSCRHSFSTWWRQNGGSLEDLKEMLGHSDLKLTLRYAHFSPEARAAAARYIGPPRQVRDATEGPSEKS